MCALPFTMLLTPRHVQRATVALGRLTLRHLHLVSSQMLTYSLRWLLAMNIGRVMYPPSNHTSARRPMHRQTSACSFHYEQIITSHCFANSGQSRRSSLPHAVVMLVSQLRSGVNIIQPWTSPSAIYPSHANIISGSSLSPGHEARRRPLLIV